MTRYLLDTNVVSELVKAKPEPLVKAFIAACPLDDLYLTEITFAEIRFGIEKQPDALKRSWLLTWLNNESSVNYSQPLECAWLFGDLR